MQRHQTCECCGHKVTAYTINLSDVMVDAFGKFMEKHIRELRWLKKWEIGLTNAQYSNFQNLRYFGIIEMIAGQRLPTEKWYRFYRGYDTIKTPCAFMNWLLLHDLSPAWETHKEGRKDVWFKDFVQHGQDHKEKYQEEKSPNLFHKIFG